MTAGARSRDGILRATLDLLAEEGFAGLTVDAVAARAGVGKATIYRHWGSRAALVHDAAGTLHAVEEEPDTGNLRDDLRALLGQLSRFLCGPDTGRILASLLDAAEREPELAALREEQIRRKRTVFARAFERGLARGELDPALDVERAVDLTVGPVFYRRLMSRASLTGDSLDRHLDLVLQAVGAGRRADV